MKRPVTRYPVQEDPYPTEFLSLSSNALALFSRVCLEAILGAPHSVAFVPFTIS